MSQTQKPSPKITHWNKPFWDAAKEEKLLIQHCKECQKYIFYPRDACPFCASENIEWVEASGKGTIYSFTVVKNNAPSAFAGDVPYTIAVIKLNEGVQMLSNIVDCDPDTIQFDMPVKVVFEKLNDEFTLPKFKPA